MRTEEDLRAALAALEDQAPLVTSVLAPISPSTPPRFARRPLPPRRLVGMLAGLGAAAVVGTAVAVVVTQSPGIAANHRQVPPAAQALPAHQVLRARVLDALSSAANDIVYEHSTMVRVGQGAKSFGEYRDTVTETWYSPARAKAGQQVRGRTLILGTGGTPISDTGVSYPEPTESKELAAGEYTDVNYATRTWSKRHSSGIFADGGPGSPLSIWELVHNFSWSVVGRTELDGHPAIELKGGVTRLWVDAQTFLPLRSVSFAKHGIVARVRGVTVISPAVSVHAEYQYLAPTAANLAKLTVPIPAGFHRKAS